MVIIVLALLGLIFGSFVNALVYRLHEQSAQGKKQRTKGKVKNKQLSISKGRSICVHCKHELAWYDLIPVLSWLLLRGKCRYCHKPISRQYPVVELVTAAIFALS